MQLRVVQERALASLHQLHHIDASAPSQHAHASKRSSAHAGCASGRAAPAPWSAPRGTRLVQRLLQVFRRLRRQSGLQRRVPRGAEQQIDPARARHLAAVARKRRREAMRRVGRSQAAVMRRATVPRKRPRLALAPVTWAAVARGAARHPAPAPRRQLRGGRGGGAHLSKRSSSRRRNSARACVRVPSALQ
jgi:hypothetical protein